MTADDSPKRTAALRPSYAPDVLIIRSEHVGLPLAAEAVRGGLTVVGYDVDEAVVNDLNAWPIAHRPGQRNGDPLP